VIDVLPFPDSPDCLLRIPAIFPLFCLHRQAVVHILYAIRVYIIFVA